MTDFPNDQYNPAAAIPVWNAPAPPSSYLPVLTVPGLLTRTTGTLTYTPLAAIVAADGLPTAIPNAVVTAGQGGIITGGILTKNSTQTAGATFAAYLYSATPATPPADNAAFLTRYANRNVLLGVINFLVQNVGSDCSTYFGAIGQGYPLPFVAAGTSLFYTLQAIGAYQAASAEQFNLNLQIQRT